MENLFQFVPFLFGAVFLFIAAVFLFMLAQMAMALVEWARNNAMPVETTPARVVTKRTHTWSSGVNNGRRRVNTSYYVTFELKSGERMELNLYGRDYGLLVEGDDGELTFQGTRYHKFDRHPLR